MINTINKKQLKEIIREVISEGNRERLVLDKLTDKVKRLCDRLEIKLLKAGAKRDQWGLYVFDFLLSKPIPDFSYNVFKMFMTKAYSGLNINQRKLDNGQAKIRILV